MRRGRQVESITLTTEENHRLVKWTRQHKTPKALALRARIVPARQAATHCGSRTMAQVRFVMHDTNSAILKSSPIFVSRNTPARQRTLRGFWILPSSDGKIPIARNGSAPITLNNHRELQPL
jgi:hypothetical protein